MRVPRYLTIMSHHGVVLFRSMQDVDIFSKGSTPLLTVGISASAYFRRCRYVSGGERPASPWQFVGLDGPAPPLSPAERPPRLLRLALAPHRLAQDSDRLRNTVDRAG